MDKHNKQIEFFNKKTTDALLVYILEIIQVLATRINWDEISEPKTDMKKKDKFDFDITWEEVIKKADEIIEYQKIEDESEPGTISCLEMISDILIDKFTVKQITDDYTERMAYWYTLLNVANEEEFFEVSAKIRDVIKILVNSTTDVCCKKQATNKELSEIYHINQKYKIHFKLIN